MRSYCDSARRSSRLMRRRLAVASLTLASALSQVSLGRAE